MQGTERANAREYRRKGDWCAHGSKSSAKHPGCCGNSSDGMIMNDLLPILIHCEELTPSRVSERVADDGVRNLFNDLDVKSKCLKGR